jgi:integrase
MVNTHLNLVTPSTNADLRTREHLTEAEVERLMNAARKNRWGHRDATMILVAYRHGFRPAELVDLRWDQVECPALTRSSATSCAPCGASSASRSPSRLSCSRRSAARRSRRWASLAERAGAEAKLR